MTPTHATILLNLFEYCGVSRFNVEIFPNGVVVFHSNGLSGAEVQAVRMVVEIFLRNIY